MPATGRTSPRTRVASTAHASAEDDSALAMSAALSPLGGDPPLAMLAAGPNGRDEAIRGGRSNRTQLLGEPSTRPGISGVAYDTAWLAGLATETDRRSSRFPTTLRWLADNQLADGSWGSSVRYEHDRVLCTLAALAPLAEFGRRAEDRCAVDAGTRYLWQHGHLIGREPVELVGFELLLPALVDRARQAGVPVPPHLDVYAQQRADKLRLIPPQALYSPRTTVVHSLEFLGDQVDKSSL